MTIPTALRTTPVVTLCWQRAVFVCPVSNGLRWLGLKSIDTTTKRRPLYRYKWGTVRGGLCTYPSHFRITQSISWHAQRDKSNRRREVKSQIDYSSKVNEQPQPPIALEYIVYQEKQGELDNRQEWTKHDVAHKQELGIVSIPDLKGNQQDLQAGCGH